MNIKELVAGLKEQGKTDEEIASVLQGIVKEIEEILNPAQEEKTAESAEENEEDKMNDVFGL